ncbi:MAG: DUF885 domain-containing protein [Hymenobacteraceae bacterium]|nr:DUF885 domain-containing protein [Hymenobacteraceae bacterium]MDX5395150.1 DUF885 domain-containing protein [Hymenobacteraceae bacterium]MDX5511191.1 DUF885 domain-containing protein [Hymenobacteraceae bacterium]
MTIKTTPVKLLWLLLLLFCFSSCRTDVSTETTSFTPDQEFDTFKNEFVEELWRLHPDWASSEGYHLYDSELVIPDAAYRAKVMAAYQQNLEKLQTFDPEKLTANNRTDLKMIENFLKSGMWYNNTFKSYEWNPAEYNIGGSVAGILNGRYDVLEARLRSISTKIANAENYYQTARQIIKQPTKEHTELAIMQNKGSLSVFGQPMLDSIQKSGLKQPEKELLKKRIETAKASINQYVQYLEQDVLKQKKAGELRSFRIGKELYSTKFKYDLVSRYSADEIFQKAKQRKEELHQNMAKLSRELWPKYFPEKAMPADSLKLISSLIGIISEKHVHRDSFMLAVEQQIPELVKFVDDKKLLTQDPEKPLVVRKTPEYMRGVAGASISAPGPYDKKADTYYNVTPLDQYTPEQAESYLREYNFYTLQILNIHEAIPGHYTQLVYSNRSPSIIKAILGSGAMVEGWAVYTERMMLEQGYGNNSPELWLMYYKWHLRVVLNTVLDYSIHVLGMTEQEAMDLLQKQGFQEKTEAAGKWRRATLSQVQLCSYFTGYTEIYDLREELKEKQGKKFDLKNFHEEFLSYGSAPVKFIRQMMLD